MPILSSCLDQSNKIIDLLIESILGGWVKLNTDGTFDTNLQLGGSDFMFRIEEGVISSILACCIYLEDDEFLII